MNGEIEYARAIEILSNGTWNAEKTYRAIQDADCVLVKRNEDGAEFRKGFMQGAGYAEKYKVALERIKNGEYPDEMCADEYADAVLKGEL